MCVCVCVCVCGCVCVRVCLQTTAPCPLLMRTMSHPLAHKHTHTHTHTLLCSQLFRRSLFLTHPLSLSPSFSPSPLLCRTPLQLVPREKFVEVYDTFFKVANGPSLSLAFVASSRIGCRGYTLAHTHSCTHTQTHTHTITYTRCQYAPFVHSICHSFLAATIRFRRTFL